MSGENKNIIKKRPILKQDIAFDYSGTDEVVTFIGSDGSPKKGNKINAGHIPTPKTTREATEGKVTISEALEYLAAQIKNKGGEASTKQRGMVQLGTIEELKKFTDNKKVYTAEVLGALKAAVDLLGLIQIATDDEAKERIIGTKCLVPKHLKLIEGIWQPGDVRMFYGNVVPAGWLEFDGTLCDRTVFAALWDYTNTQHMVISEAEWTMDKLKRGFYSDGDGTVNFRLPDLRGYFPRILDPTGEVDPNGATMKIGDCKLSKNTIPQDGGYTCKGPDTSDHKGYIASPKGDNNSYWMEGAARVFEGDGAYQNYPKYFGIKLIVKT